MQHRWLLMLLFVILLCDISMAETPLPGNATPADERSLQEIASERESLRKINHGTHLENACYIPDSLVRDIPDTEQGNRMIIASDDRIIVHDPSAYPYSAIAYMIVHARCGCEWTCSGFMVGPRGLITAGHCLFCDEHQMTVDQITFYFGYRSSQKYFYKYDGSTTYWYGTRDYSNSREWDYGYVLMDECVGDRTGWLGVSTLDDTDFNRELLTVAGYREGELKKDMGFACVENSTVISYDIDTVPGYSGCPVFYYRYGDVYAVAINVSHSEYNSLNYARRINYELLLDMIESGIFT